MGQTLQQMLTDDWTGSDVGTEKTASAQGSDANIEKLAAELGIDLGGDTVTEQATINETSTEKVASADLLSDVAFEDFFEDDLGTTQTEKTAEEQKLAASEEAFGAMVYDHFVDRFDKRIEKLAMNAVSSPVASIGSNGQSNNPHGDSRPPQTMPQNKPSNSEQAIDTTPQVDNQLPPQSGNHISGSESTGMDASQKTASVQAAIRKQLISSILNG